MKIKQDIKTRKKEIKGNQSEIIEENQNNIDNILMVLLSSWLMTGRGKEAEDVLYTMHKCPLS